MKNWLTSQNRKVHQRAMNRAMRAINKNIEQDDLWNGRFIVRQREADWIPYEDNSGWELYVTLKFIDRCTGRYFVHNGSVNHWIHWDGSALWRAMNDFIVERCDVWNEELARTDRQAWREYNKNVRRN
jgi:hypothetical protein